MTLTPHKFLRILHFSSNRFEFYRDIPMNANTTEVKGKACSLFVSTLLARSVSLNTLLVGGLFSSVMGFSSLVAAAPEGGVVVGGSGSIDAPNDDKVTQVNQFTDLMAVNWQSFNLAADEKVLFVQPSSSSLVLNRILDDNASTIRGSIDANGHVLLVNPNGVLFTESASVNVGGIAVSGLDINPNDFMNGDYKLSGEVGKSGSVINYGTINASSAALLGKRVENHGLIKADVVSLSAADEAIVTFDSDGLIGVQISKAVLEKEAGVENAVLNAGTIEGKQVLLDASVSKDLFDAAVNNTGSIKAQGIDTSGGKIRLFGSGGAVKVAGSLDASGDALKGGLVHIEGDHVELTGQVRANSAAGKAGAVDILGEQVALLSGSSVDALGATGGGDIRIGGSYKGQDRTLVHAEKSIVEKGARVAASATDNGSGGTIVAWADAEGFYSGRFEANGAGTGSGGFIETSARSIYLNEITVSTRGASGAAAGAWLIDPDWLEIVSVLDADSTKNKNKISVSMVQENLSENNLIIESSTYLPPVENSQRTGIKLSADLHFESTAGHTLTLIADGALDSSDALGIELNGNITSEADANVNLTLISNKDIEFNGDINLGAGALDATAVGDVVVAKDREIEVSSFSSRSGGGFENNGVITSAGTVTIEVGDELLAGTDLSDAEILAELGQVNAASILAYALGGKVTFSFETDSSNPSADYVIKNDGGQDVQSLKVNAEGLSVYAEIHGESTVNFTGEKVNVSVDVSDANDPSNYAFGLVEKTGGSAGAKNSQIVISGDGSGTGGFHLKGVAAVNNTRRLVLTSDDDAIELDDLATGLGIHTASIEFTGLSEVDAGEGDDSVTGIGEWTLLGASGSARNSDIDFSSIKYALSEATVLKGSEIADSVTIVSSSELEAWDITFGVTGGNDFTQVDLGNHVDSDGKFILDEVTGLSAEDWIDITESKGATNAGIKFTGLD
ncbi:two-partner secretion domain-containing protein, partial [Simiduia curdlanivorans]